ncbi:MAG: site-specific integrase, partial [Marinovum sp.]|nr:site-specific integrase [Marinovum sp.]
MSDGYFDIRGDGSVVLYLNKAVSVKNPKWQARIKVRGASGYRRQSLRTTDFAEAKVFAIQLYDELNFSVMQGLTLNPKSFSAVFDEYIAKQGAKYQSAREISNWNKRLDTLKLYALPYFAKMRIDNIKTNDFSDYLDDRRINFKRKPPTNETLIKERSSILGIFNYALEKGYIVKIPSFPKPTGDLVQRDSWTEAEYKKINAGMREWVRAGKKTGSWKERYIFQQYFYILTNTGMRIGEARDITWGDFKRVNHLSVVTVFGKTKKRRDVVFTQGADRYLKHLYDLRVEELKGEKPSLDEYVFLSRRGNGPVESYKTAFNSMIKFCGIPKRGNNGDRTLYSCRHYYATHQIQKQNANVFILANQMGTSVDMI